MNKDNNDYFSSSDSYRQMPLFKKGEEIIETVRQIASLIPEDDTILQDIMGMILGDAYMLTAKIANAEGGEFYDLKMQNAAIIRKAAMDLFVSYHSLKMHGFKHAEYYMMVRELIEEYCQLFVKWVDSFDKSLYLVDRWNMFNPPGVHYTDKDPDIDFGFDFDDDDDDDFFGFTDKFDDEDII